MINLRFFCFQKSYTWEEKSACKTPIFISKKGPVLKCPVNWTGSVFHSSNLVQKVMREIAPTETVGTTQKTSDSLLCKVSDASCVWLHLLQCPQFSWCNGLQPFYVTAFRSKRRKWTGNPLQQALRMSGMSLATHLRKLKLLQIFFICCIASGHVK